MRQLNSLLSLTCSLFRLKMSSMKKWFLLLLTVSSLYAFDRAADFHSLEKETIEVLLKVEGEIPSWIEGTYVRNGPSKFFARDQALSHWFDGLSMLHAFHLEGGQCIYSNRFLETNAYQYMKEGLLPPTGFSKTPSLSIDPLEGEFYPKRPNAVVNVAQFDQAAVALTEIPTPVTFDLESLKTIGVFNYEDKLPKDRCYSTAHLHEREGKIYGYLAEIGSTSRYIFYSQEKNSRHELCSIPIADPSYVHSFSLTDNYLLFIDYPLRLNFERLLSGEGFIQSFEWNEEGESRFYVINRHTGACLKTIKGPPFFSFHHINAFEEGEKIIVDLIGYSDAQVIFGKGDTDLGYRRLVIDHAVSCSHVIEIEAELPRIHYELYNGKPYQFFYATCFRKNIHPSEAPPIYKVDVLKGTFQTWAQRGYFASEPVFIPHPEGKREDEGVLLSILTRHDHTDSFLLVLDAVTLKEIARAHAPHGIPQGLHGKFFNQ